MNYINFEKINSLSKADNSVAMYQKIIKLSEEAGEISDALDTWNKPLDIKEVVEETCDTINVAVDIINALNANNEIGEDTYQIDMDTSGMFAKETYSLREFVNRINSEVGKCSQNFLRFDGSKNVSKSGVDGKHALSIQVNNVIKWCDITIKAIEANYVDITEDFIVEMFNKKLDKWQAKTEKYKA